MEKKHNQDMVIRSRVLRKMQTDVEKILWDALRNRKLMRYKFRRQHLVAGYIVDFICLERKLIVEVDGFHHQFQQEYDAVRTKTFEGAGFRVLRFWNNEVLENLQGVLEQIAFT